MKQAWNIVINHPKEAYENVCILTLRNNLITKFSSKDELKNEKFELSMKDLKSIGGLKEETEQMLMISKKNKWYFFKTLKENCLVPSILNFGLIDKKDEKI